MVERVALVLDEGLSVSLWVSQPGCAKGVFFSAGEISL